MKRLISAVTIALILATGASSAAAGQWLHVRVQERGSGDEVKVNLPLAFAEAILPLVEDNDLRRELRRHGLRIDGRRLWTLEELRQAWETLKSQGNADLVSIETRWERVKVGLEGGYLIATCEDRSQGEVDVRIPSSIIDALLSGSGDDLDLRSALRALRNGGTQELVSIRDRDSSVRIWVDDQAGQ